MIFSRFRKPKPQESPQPSVREANLVAQNFELKKQLELVTKAKDNLGVELELLKIRNKELIPVNLGDPAPIDGEKRKLYVSQVAGVHKEILEPKFKQMISTAHTLLESSDNNRDADIVLKGGIYMLWEIIRWGQSMVNEQVANQMNQNPSLSEEENNN